MKSFFVDENRICKWSIIKGCLVGITTSVVAYETMYTVIRTRNAIPTIPVLAVVLIGSVILYYETVYGAIWLISVYALSCFSPLNVQSSIVMPVTLAIALLSYKNYRWGILSSLICSILLFLSIYTGDSSLSSWYVVTIFVIFVFFSFIGSLWKAHIRYEDLLREKSKWEEYKRNLGMTSILHNSVCNDLVYVLSLISLEEKDELDTSEIQRVIEESLRKVRRAIGIAQGNNLEPKDGICNTSENGSSIRQILDIQDSRLGRLGYTGLSVCEQATEGLTLWFKELIEDILEELYGNIIKYGSHDEPYGVFISVDGETVRIVSINRICIAEAKYNSSNTGIVRLRERIALLQGEFVVTAEDGNWKCVINIPLQAAEKLFSTWAPRKP